MPLTYALISALILCCGYLCYRWIMADERQHSYNRALLYIIYAVALMMPFFLLPGFSSPDAADTAMIEFGELKAIGPAGAGAGSPSGSAVSFPLIARILVIVYLIGVTVMVAVSLTGLIALLRVISKGEKLPAGKYILVITDNTRLAPFSWMRYIVMTSADYSENGPVIMAHELCHLRRRHWIDLIVAQGVICIQWFNPAAWLMRDELRSVHEYQADEAVITSGADISGYQKMLIKKAVGSRFQSFANSLNHSKLKKRVTMMYKEKSSAVRRMSALLLAPALAAGCFATAIPAVASVLDSFAEVSLAPESENKVNKNSATPEIKMPAAAPTITETEQEAVMETPAEAPAAISVEEVAAVSEEPAEEAAAPEEKKERRKVHQAPEKCAEFPGGMRELLNYLSYNIRYPEEAMKNDEQGLVVVKFVIEADGSVNEVEAIKGVSPSLDQEAVRVVKSLPKWNPGLVDGKPVATWFTLPVNFKISVEKKENSEK